MSRTNLSLLSLAVLFTLAAGSTGRADLYYVGDGVTPGNAGTGAWSNVSTDWSTDPVVNTPSAWVAGTGAVFEGTTGGTVTNANETLDVGSVTYTAAANAFSVVNDATINVNGAGITNSSSHTQSFTNNGTLAFNNSASAGTGAVSIDNFNTLTFANSSQGGSASVINEGGASTNFFTLTSTALTIASLNNAGGAIRLGEENITATALTLQDTVANNGIYHEGDGLYYTLGTNNGILHTSSLTVSGVSDIYVSTAVNFAGLPSYTLLTDGSGILSLSNYVLDSGPANYELRLGAGNTTLDLVAVPEMSSFAIPLLGAAGLFWMRRRRSSMLSVGAMA